MAIANTLQQLLYAQRIGYDVLAHPRATCSSETARLAHIPSNKLAKAVLLEDKRGYLLAVLPASHHIQFSRPHHALQRRLGLATEKELTQVFRDCEPGAVPPFGAAYGVDRILDDSLLEQPDVYFEAGSHQELVHVSSKQFVLLAGEAKRARFSRHA